MSYESNFRRALGFTNQEVLKKYFKAKDFVVVNWKKIERCNERLVEICVKLNNAVHASIRYKNIDELKTKIESSYFIMKENDIFPRLNNQGRNPDDVYYNWMRGYLICEFFIPSIAQIFGIEVDEIKHIGEDDLARLDTFARAATADLELMLLDGNIIRLEMQAGFTGVNDIKRSKINEAKQKYDNDGISSYIVHFDVFNGVAAIIDISNVDESVIVYHKAFENTDVLTIDKEWFRWLLAEPVRPLEEILVTLYS